MAYEENEDVVPERKVDNSLDIEQILEIYERGENLAEYVDEDDLEKMGTKVIEDYERDKESRSGWDDRNNDALELVMQVAKAKTWPWDGASNVRFPLITIASQHFAARVFSDLVPEPYPVKGVVYGYRTDEKQRAADRIGMHMSWQLTQQMRTWVDEQDTLVHVLPISGCCFKKTYRDTVKKQNVSELVLPNKLVFSYHAKDVEDAECKTEWFDINKREIEENKRMGVYRNCDYGLADDSNDKDDNSVRDEVNKTDKPENASEYRFLEQHTWWDLDGDGCEEPYIITIAEESRKIARIVPRFDEDSIEVIEGKDGKARIGRITADEYYTQYVFIPDPSGGNLGIGWGHLLYHINESINTILNQLIDNGTLDNLNAHTEPSNCPN